MFCLSGRIQAQFSKMIRRMVHNTRHAVSRRRTTKEKHRIVTFIPSIKVQCTRESGSSFRQKCIKSANPATRQSMESGQCTPQFQLTRCEQRGKSWENDVCLCSLTGLDRETERCEKCGSDPTTGRWYQLMRDTGSGTPSRSESTCAGRASIFYVRVQQA